MTVSSGIIKKGYTSRDFRIWLVLAYSRINGVGHGVATLFTGFSLKNIWAGVSLGQKTAAVIKR